MNDPQVESAVTETDTSLQYFLIEMLECVPGKSPVKTIIRKQAGEVTAATFITDDAFSTKTAVGEILVQIVEGSLELVIDGQPNLILYGQSLIIHPGSAYKIINHVRFSMISTSVRIAMNHSQNPGGTPVNN